MSDEERDRRPDADDAASPDDEPRREPGTGEEPAAPGETGWRVRRILVALDASPASAAAARTAAELAAELEAELAGLFVEDADLARLGSLPAVFEVGSHSAGARRLSARELERGLRAQAARARRLFETSAARVSVQTSFRVVRGAVVQEVTAAAAEAELLSLGRVGAGGVSRLGSVARAALARGRGSVLLLGPEGRLAPPVLVVFGDSPAAERALAAATRLPARDHDLVVLLPASDDETAAHLRQRARSLVTGHPWGLTPGEMRFVRVRPGDRHAAAHAVSRERGRVLVLPASSDLLDGADLERVVENLDCAVLLVR